MNKKGKNKKGKVPNPVPVQEEKSGDTVEDLRKSGENIENVGVTVGDKKDLVGLITDIIPNLEEKVESLKEKRVPEIVSEITTSAVDVKDEETPKKPKRNRGKKKKGKDDEFDDDLDEKFKEVDIQPSIETKVDIPEVETKMEELPLITPTARKKKNKKKNADQKAEDLTSPDQELPSIPIKTEIKEPEIKESIPDIKQEFLKTDITDQEVKPSKKKNKKKKRTDSEKSDKEEYSCTSAFQMLLGDKEESKVKMEDNIDVSIIPFESVKANVENIEIKLEKTEQTLPIQPIIEKEPTPKREVEENKDISAPESKGKKKNKKDKKQTLKLEEIPKLDETNSDVTTSLIDFGTSAESVVAELMKDIPTSSLEDKIKEITVTESPESLIEDLSPKPKAKIAKPVEKKRKGKHETEIFPQDTFLPEFAKVEDDPFKVKLEIIETEPVVLDKLSDVESQTKQLGITSNITFTAPDEDEKLIAQEFELLAEKAMGKKRKKGSKMPKALDIGIQEPKTESDVKQIDIKETAKEQLAVITEILTPQTDQQEFIIKSEKSGLPSTVDTVKEIKEETPKPVPIEFQGKVLLTPEDIGEEIEFTKTDENVQSTEDKQKTDNKSGKKRKKSPKSPRNNEEMPKPEERALTPKTEVAAKETSKSEEISQQSLAEKVDASNITRMYDIEISSIRASESEGSASDLVPDVTYPRASSQQLHDDNNNTVIREIFPPAETLLDIPFIQEREQTPKKNQENRSPPKEEKTDIKSKMLEVNQDMEELRLSIERSLAELTSMEKSEEAIEKEFEATRNKAKNVASLLFDTAESTTTQMPSAQEKIRDRSPIVETAVSIPLEEIKMPTVIEDSNKQKPEGKPKAEDKKSKKDKQKKTPKEEKKIELPFVESKVVQPFLIDSQTIEMPPKAEDRPLTPVDKLPGIEKPLPEQQKIIESFTPPIALPPVEEKMTEIAECEKKDIDKTKEQSTETPIDVPPVCPARKDNKGKNKKKKGKQDTQMTATTQSTTTTAQSQPTQETKKEEKTESKTESKSESKRKSQSTEKGKQQASDVDLETQDEALDYEPIENFEDALTSSIDDVNKTFEMIVKETQEQNNPKINIIAPDEEKSTVSPPKNLLGHPDIPVRSNRRDFKKEKDKIPNEITARVKIKDSVEVERKQTKNTQTNNKMKDFSKDYKMDDNDDFVYKYSFRKVFLQSSCHVCKKNLSGCRVPCSYCNLLLYCSNKHKDEDWPQHQALCFAVSTIVHLKDQKHIYGDAKNLTGHDYRLIRMQMIVSCEKVLKRRLVPWEQEALLYPRICAHVPCREWRQSKLSDCQGCGQISFCTENADHCPKSHSRWCKSYSLYEKLVCYQQTKGRLEPKMPTKVLQQPQQIPEKINEVLASMYEEKIDITDIQYAALTQLATAPLTAAYCHQLCRTKTSSLTNGVNKKSSFTIHVVGAELQFEADALNKWEVFFLHLRPDLQELRVVLINYNLNPSNLPLELLGKIKLCENCRQNKRRVMFDFQDKRTYADYKSSEDFLVPDIVCAFNPSIQRSSVYNGKDPWPSTIDAILKLKVPFIITGYTITELHKDCIRIKECSETGYTFIAEPKYNNFASVRPDRNFISDDEMPLLFKNYCLAIISA